MASCPPVFPVLPALAEGVTLREVAPREAALQIRSEAAWLEGRNAKHVWSSRSAW